MPMDVILRLHGLDNDVVLDPALHGLENVVEMDRSLLNEVSMDDEPVTVFRVVGLEG